MTRQPEAHVSGYSRRGAIAFIYATVVLDVMASSMAGPSLPRLIVTLADGDVKRGAEILGLCGTLFWLMQFLFSLAQGALSDRFGRRPVLLVSTFGLAADYVILAVAPTLGWVVGGRIISGATAASISTSVAYVTDITEPEGRARAFGLIGIAITAGAALGPAIGGVLTDMDPRLPFWVAAGLSLANWLYGLAILPESLAPERRTALAWARVLPSGAVGLLTRTGGLLRLTVANFLLQVTAALGPGVFVLYTGYRYGWTARDVGLTLAGLSLLSILVQGRVGAVVRRLGEHRGALLGIGIGVAAAVVQGLASSTSLFVVGLLVSLPAAVVGPIMQSLMSRHVGDGDQGRLQGALVTVIGVANLIGPGLFTVVFAHTVERADLDLPGAAFFVAAMISVLAMIFIASAARQPEAAATPAVTRHG